MEVHNHTLLSQEAQETFERMVPSVALHELICEKFAMQPNLTVGELRQVIRKDKAVDQELKDAVKRKFT